MIFFRISGRMRPMSPDNMMAALFRMVENIQTTGGIAALLAILIALTLCGVYVRDPTHHEDLGKALIYALTTIIGFYFGTAASPRSTTTPASPPAINGPSSTR
jgi:hypothetical protein